ncbi:hypothetical protein PIIN_05592 [Serendipita indica DSM 11827]|uniref:5'-deoxynucleotidase n=1 Tax=Serendipita indica (strain DSM 11827) TaxID=1109443 RepID=G4TK24_SERID|nr:hypothetical protein PIIN_05592 [Serendipita indica DSM 11827]
MSSTQRVFGPSYRSSGDAAQDRLAFFHILEALKTQKRTGWIPDAESISDHMYRMAVLALCSEDTKLDISKCVMLAVVHDLAEATVGDITPDEGISKEEKKQLEENAMRNFCEEMLQKSSVAQRVYDLWKEYEDQVTPEAKFVKDLDRIEMALQAREYERRHSSSIPDLDLRPFYNSSIPKLQTDEVKRWGEALMEE